MDAVQVGRGPPILFDITEKTLILEDMKIGDEYFYFSEATGQIIKMIIQAFQGDIESGQESPVMIDDIGANFAVARSKFKPEYNYFENEADALKKAINYRCERIARLKKDIETEEKAKDKLVSKLAKI